MVDHFGEETLRQCPGFVDKNGKITFWAAVGQREGYVVPFRSEAGLIAGLQLKLLGGRYETARNSRTAGMYHVAGPGLDLYATEGPVKAQVAHRLGGITVPGFAGQSLAAKLVELIKGFGARRVIVAIDQECNVCTDWAREAWLRAFALAGLPTYNAVWGRRGRRRAKGHR